MIKGFYLMLCFVLLLTAYMVFAKIGRPVKDHPEVLGKFLVPQSSYK